MRKIAAERSCPYIDLDDYSTRNAATKDPVGFIHTLPTPVVIDEIQRTPDLLYEIKRTLDRDMSPGQFILTGSSNILTAPRVYKSLAGRIEVIRLWPFS